jgi:hypothetical protein
MKGFKLQIKPKRLKKTKNGTYPYLVSGPKQFLDFYKEQQGEGLLEDDDTGAPLFFHKDLFVFGGEITFIEDRDYPFSGSPNAQSALALQAMEGMMSSMGFGASNDKDESENDSDGAELDKPASKPKGVIKKIGKK